MKYFDIDKKDEQEKKKLIELKKNIETEFEQFYKAVEIQTKFNIIF